ncbi:MAG TPA: hypothetical protein VLS45_09085 [Methylomicrobium sp.]|nr:hypothetical protein [Methylomicrobium sp.]
MYDGILRQIVDEHVPAYTAPVRDRGLSPWFDDECRKSRRYSRMLERRYRRTLTTGDRLAWIQQVHAMHDFYRVKENQFWTNRIAASSRNSATLWKSISSVLLRDRNASIQPSPELTADRLAEFFVDKVEGVRAATADAEPPTFTPNTTQRLSSFQRFPLRMSGEFCYNHHRRPALLIRYQLPFCVMLLMCSCRSSG